MAGFLLTCLLILASAATAEANVPLVPVAYLLTVSLISIVKTSGIALISIIVIEALVIRAREKVGAWRALHLSARANIYSSFIGIGIVLLSSTGTIYAVGIIALSALFTRMTRSLAVHSGTLSCARDRRWSIAAVYAAVGILSMVLGILTIPGHSFSAPAAEFASSTEKTIAIIAACALVLIGFGMSVLSEAQVLSRRHPHSGTDPVITSLLMNAASYAILLAASGEIVRTVIADKSWYWHH